MAGCGRERNRHKGSAYNDFGTRGHDCPIPRSSCKRSFGVASVRICGVDAMATTALFKLWLITPWARSGRKEATVSLPPGFLGDRKHPIFAGDNAGREIKKGWPDGPRVAIH